tara:strand:+ start:418 stop:582 length:165 start_codon:yes stop_codon:yes gene_type:complete
MAIMTVICKACGKDDEWEGFEDMVRVTGREGDVPVKVTIGGCACGHQQEVNMND